MKGGMAAKKGPHSRADKAEVSRMISGRLRAYFDQIADEPVDERWKDLLDKLDMPPQSEDEER